MHVLIEPFSETTESDAVWGVHIVILVMTWSTTVGRTYCHTGHDVVNYSGVLLHHMFYQGPYRLLGSTSHVHA